MTEKRLAVVVNSSTGSGTDQGKIDVTPGIPHAADGLIERERAVFDDRLTPELIGNAAAMGTPHIGLLTESSESPKGSADRQIPAQRTARDLQTAGSVVNSATRRHSDLKCATYGGGSAGHGAIALERAIGDGERVYGVAEDGAAPSGP